MEEERVFLLGTEERSSTQRRTVSIGDPQENFCEEILLKQILANRFFSSNLLRRGSSQEDPWEEDLVHLQNARTCTCVLFRNKKYFKPSVGSFLNFPSKKSSAFPRVRP